jgi:hypothetical protein
MSLKLKDLAGSAMVRVVKKKVVKIAVKIPQVIENTYRKNVRFSPLHDVHENKRVKPFSPRCC